LRERRKRKGTMSEPEPAEKSSKKKKKHAKFWAEQKGKKEKRSLAGARVNSKGKERDVGEPVPCGGEEKRTCGRGARGDY